MGLMPQGGSQKEPLFLWACIYVMWEFRCEGYQNALVFTNLMF